MVYLSPFSVTLLATHFIVDMSAKARSHTSKNEISIDIRPTMTEIDEPSESRCSALQYCTRYMLNNSVRLATGTRTTKHDTHR